jgi:hypothetical protein
MHAMSPSCLTGGHSCKGIILVKWLFIWRPTPPFIALIQRFQCFSTIAKRDRFEYLQRSLSIAHIMKSDDKCPLLAILVWSQPMG